MIRKFKKTLFTIIIVYLILSLVVFIFMIYSLIEMPKQVFKYNRNIEKNYYSEIYKTKQTEQENEYYIRHDINNIIVDLGQYNVYEFFNQYTRNHRITESILRHSIEIGVPVNLAFSVAWAESRFNPYAINNSNSNGTADWGLFQLNDNYYRWTRDQFFNIEKNIQAGISHLDFVIKEMDEIYYALAAYNAGVNGVRTRGVPNITLRYINNILEYEDYLNREFNIFIQEVNSEN